MKKSFLTFLFCVGIILCFCSCTTGKWKSTFHIRFIDVGQGDSALVECDGHYMLIDGGDTSAGDKVYNVLKEENVRNLDLLVVSHLHEDHYAGLSKALTYTSEVGTTFCNDAYVKKKSFPDFEHALYVNGSQITLPDENMEYKLGNAKIEVLYSSAEKNNDSLVLLVTYKKTKFLFTGDIEDAAQTKICDKYQNDLDEPLKVNLIKMPHHGDYSGSLYRFLRTFTPDCAVISVGANNYGHPDQNTINMLDNFKIKTYRTDQDGDILVRSNGKAISIESSK